MEKDNSINRDKPSTSKPKLPIDLNSPKQKRNEDILDNAIRIGVDGVKLKLRFGERNMTKNRNRSNSLLSSQTDESSQTVISRRSIQTDMNKALARNRNDYLEDETLIPSSRSMNRLTLGETTKQNDFTKKSIAPKKRNLESVSEVN